MAGTTNPGTQGAREVFGAVGVAPFASGAGLDTFRSLDLQTGTLGVVKASPGMIYQVLLTNRASTIRYAKFYDAVSGTLGTGTPKYTIPIPGNSSDATTLIEHWGGLGVTFATGICVGASTGFADNDTGAPNANDVLCTVFYK